ncbi:MAG TPA: hypothetical protein VMZ74_05035 [Ramlibacter sp.]|nr:hypothetical protein [Ramlibacter sp.]
MSFLNQLKTQAKTLQTQQEVEIADLDKNTADAEKAVDLTLFYLRDLARQLNVISPAAPKFSLDGKTPWPAMKFLEFRVDSRKKKLRDKEVCEFIGMGWRVMPQIGNPVGGTVKVNFPPDLQRVEARLMMGPVKHERKELRDPANNKLIAYQFDYMTETRGSLMVTPDHDKGQVAFRIMNATGFEVLTTTYPATMVKHDVLDELAKLIVSQPHRFL